MSGVTFRPNANFYGTTTFTYTIGDGNGGTASAIVNVTVTPVADPPVALDDSVSVAEDGGATVIDVLANDADADNLSGPANAGLAVTSVTQPVGGAVLLSNGEVSFTPDHDFFGPTWFTYTISDGTTTSTATVNLTVTEVNDPPVAVLDEVSTDEDTTVSGNVLANDFDPDNLDGIPGNEDALTVTDHTDPAHGSLSLAADGSFTYTPDHDYNGSDAFTYTIGDGRDGSATATVMLTIRPINDPATISAINDQMILEDGTTGADRILRRRRGRGGVDVDGHGDLGRRRAGSGGRDRAGGLGGQPHHHGDSGSRRVRLGDHHRDRLGRHRDDLDDVHRHRCRDQRRAGGEPGPVATSEDVPLIFSAGDLLVNDTDPDNQDTSAANDDTLAVTAVSPTSSQGGSVTLAAGTVVYTPAIGFNGIDTFTYTLSEGRGGSDTGTVTVDVGPVNDAPVNGVPGPQAVAEDGTLVFSSANGNAIAISDSDAADADVE